MQIIAFLVIALLCFCSSCTREPFEQEINKGDLYLVKEYAIYSQNEKNNQILQSLYAELDKPILSYPVIDYSLTEQREDGLLYRESQGVPFTGQVVLKGKDGFLLMKCVYYKGLPHGKMERFHRGNFPSMEAIYINGNLAGTKISWWDNGNVKEEEYWGKGQYQGKSLWDRVGRLIRKESLPPDP